jgi:pentatricopeptide repeat protein
MDWMVNARGMNMSYANHAIRLDLIHKVRGIQAAENYFDGLPDSAKNHRTYGALLNCYCSARMEVKATDLYRKMDELGILSSTLPINNLMILYMKLGQQRKVDSLFEEMKVKNVKPDSLTCCILMTSYAASNKVDAIEELLKDLAAKDVTLLQWSVYSTIASIYVNAGLVEKAESALKKLEGLVGDSDDRQPFDFLMSLYASAGNLSEVNRVWDRIKAKFSKVTNTSYLGMLQALYKLNDLDHLKQIFQEWESSYETYDMRLTNMMIHVHLKSNKAEEAESLSEKAKEKGAEIDSKTCELFLDHYMGKGDMTLALNWVDNMTKLPRKAWKLDQDRIHKFQKNFEENKDADCAVRFCNCLRTLCCIDGKAYESLLRTYLAAGKTNHSRRQQIKDDKIEICYDIGKLLKRMGDKGR